MYGHAAFTDADHTSAQAIGKVHVLFKLCKGTLVLKGGEKAREPHIADLQTAQIERLLEHIKILGVFAATLTALVSSQSHLAQALLISQFAAQRGQIIVRPVDRRAAKLYLHIYSP